METPTEPEKRISLKWNHGLGDSCNLAHCLPLWINRGYSIEVACPEDHAPIFRAAGAEIVAEAEVEHPYGELMLRPPANPSPGDEVSTSKIGFNLAQHPMPVIGRPHDLWPEVLDTKLSLKRQLKRKSKQEIDEFVAGVGGPLIVVHTRGRSSRFHREFSTQQESELYRELLCQTNATLLLLDSDDRVSRLNSRRVLHLTDDFRELNPVELAYLLDQADLLIGIDSGPSHLVRFTNTPALICWFDTHPSIYQIPRMLTANLCDGKNPGWNRARRHSHNIIDVERITGKAIAEQAARMLDGADGLELTLEHCLGKLRQDGGALDWFADRQISFGLFLTLIEDMGRNPMVVETGCVRSEDDWRAGNSTYLLGLFLFGHDGHLHSVDSNAQNVALARKVCEPFPVTIHHRDSVEWLGTYSGPPIDALYLDTLDANSPNHGPQAEREIVAALRSLAPHAVVLLDDAQWIRGGWQGKGAAVPLLEEQGFQVAYSGYQTLLVRAPIPYRRK